jgi:hypothetical protein
MLFLKKAKSLIRALWSLFWFGTVEAKTYRRRALECFFCEARIEKKRRMYCGACGCPQWWLSDLRKKWRMLELKCPLDKW